MSDESTTVMPDNTSTQQTQQQQMADIDKMLQGDAPAEKPAKKPDTTANPEPVTPDEPPEMDTAQGTDGDQTDSVADENDDGETVDELSDEEIDAEEKERRIKVYAEVVNMPGGHEPLTVGELKNEVLDYRQNAQAMVDRENDVMRQFEHVMTIADSLPELDAQQVAAINQVQAQHRQKQSALLMKAIPSWTNERTFAEDKASMVTMLDDYGITEDDLNKETDHRLIKMAYDYDRLKRRIAKASAVNASVVSGSNNSGRKTLQVKKGQGHKKPTDQKPAKKRDNFGGNLSGQMEDIEALLKKEKIK